ncbi:kinesin-like protein 3A isoform X2 [Leptinotarsa decemlineata]|uniref:kinesin-like protein 3A isoform X2 n=1 Tax=Leptinotarsa decemlineata TaxID=7539 RepID=UPI003D30D672
MADVSVRVAVRVRPLVFSEIERGCKEILEVVEENDQIVVKSIDKDKAFTYNYVLSGQSEQIELYKRCVQPLIENLFKGYNVTILAYGQTGSGKTHSMGTAYTGEEDTGIIPRAIADIFEFVNDNFVFNFTVTVSFMELYQEVLYDLLSTKSRDQCVVELREDPVKGILIPGLTEVKVESATDVLEALQRGSCRRATGSTAMNSQSSRSHAIFTVNISMQNKENCSENKQAKLHLVDLAGSERPKKTGAIGTTFKEGVNINKGLFVLGNVISCLGDEKTQNGFIPYRDSNLTRLLKDSLGGNSITLMIACVSPADYNIEETLSTLRYADRARKIKNKPIVNQDAKVAEINDLKRTIQQLRLQILGQGGPMVCPAELELLKREIIELKLKLRDLTEQLSAALLDNTGLHEKIMILQSANEALNNKICALKDQYDVTFNNISLGLENNDTEVVKDNLLKFQQIQSQFMEIGDEQKKTEMEIRNHEEAFNKHLIHASSLSNEEGVSKEFEEKKNTHTNRQINLNMQLTEIQKQLIIKESLAKQLMTNNKYIVDYQALEDNNEKILNLEKERDELLQQLKSVGNSGKIAEQRRKRVQELEIQLAELARKVQEQARLIKMKAKDEDRIARLNQDILQMKQAKVKLVRTMREESDKFRQWRLQKERECQRLKQQDRKKENEIVKMKAMHSKQQIVFKRRVEEAEAVNKRLKNLLALRKQNQDSKLNGKVDKLEPWLKREYDLHMNLVEAEATLKVLLDDRATLRHQLDDLKSNPDTTNSSECKSIEEDLELRSVQIQDLQQKLLDSDEDKTKSRFDKFQTMSEAKFGLKFLFSRAADCHREKVHIQSKLDEIQEIYNEATEKLRIADETEKSNAEAAAQALLDIQKEYEEKISILLGQMKEKEKVLQEQEETIRTIKQKNEELVSNQEYILRIAMKNENIYTPTKENNFKSMTQKLSDNEEEMNTEIPAIRVLESTFVKSKPLSPTEEETSVTPKNQMFERTFAVKDKDEESDLSIIDDDIENDPDWRKTPLGRRLMEEKRRGAFGPRTDNREDKPVKRSSEGGCTCKTDCSGGRCGCRKMSRSCGSTCKCISSGCKNRDTDNSSTVEPADSSSFKVPNGCEMDELPHKKKKTRLFFSRN